MSLRGRIGDRVNWEFVKSWKCGVLVTLLAVVVVIFVVLQVIWPSLQPETTENSTPRFLQSRGVDWHIFIEEPIQFEEIHPIVVVFADQVNTLFKIRTYSILYEYIENDGIENYSSGYSGRVYAAFQAPRKGPVEIPIYFLIGHGWSWDPPRKFTAWAYPTPQSFEDTDDLLFRIVVAKETEERGYVGLTANKMNNLMTMLHEFGHNTGLKDLYVGGDVVGCDDLLVIMASVGLSLDREENVYDSPPQYERLVMNRTRDIRSDLEGTESVTIRSVEEAYLENNTLHFVIYRIIERDGGEVRLSNANVVTYDLEQFQSLWTKEEAAFIGMDGRFSFSCPQEFE